MAEAARARDDSRGAALDELELAVLALEAAHPRHSARKDELIRRELGLTATRYYRILGTLVETPAALEHDPVLVSRLRRIQQTRAEQRAARRAIRQAGARATREKIR